jgi:hypothetical protein
VEAMTTIAESRAATSAAAASGLETWTAVTVDRSGGSLLSGEPLDAWVEAIAPLRPAALLVSGAPEALAPALTRIAMLAPDIGARPGAYATLASDAALAPDGTETDRDLAAYAETAKALLAAGARILGGGRGTTPAHTRALRAVIDEDLEAERSTAAQSDATWQQLVRRAGAMAGGGRAVVVSDADRLPPRNLDELLARYDVLRAPALELERLPAGAFRLAVVDISAMTAARTDLLRRVAPGLEPGGWVVARIDTAGDGSAPRDLRLEGLDLAGLEIRELATDGDSTTLLARRPT